MTIKLMLVAEFDVDDEIQAQAALDRFRKVSLPGPCRGITLPRATFADQSLCLEKNFTRSMEPGVEHQFLSPWKDEP